MTLKQALGTRCRLLFALLLFSGALFSVGCDPIQEMVDVNSDADSDAAARPETSPVFIGEADDRFGTDTYQLNAATITGDILTVNATYGGGCRTHRFTLVVSETFQESSPVQLAVSLAHDADADPCRALLRESYHFGMTPIKRLYQKGYAQKAGIIVLQLKEAPEVDLVYEFSM